MLILSGFFALIFIFQNLARLFSAADLTVIFCLTFNIIFSLF